MSDKKKALISGAIGGIVSFFSMVEIFRWADTQTIDGAKFEPGFWMWAAVLFMAAFVTLFSASRTYADITGKKEGFDTSPRLGSKVSTASLLLLTLVVVVVVVSVLKIVATM